MRLGSVSSLATHTVRALLAALMLALAVPVSAGAIGVPVSGDMADRQESALAAARLVHGVSGQVSALAADDEVPGISVTSPHSGAIDLNAGDYLDVLRVVIPAGQVFTADITMSGGEWVAGALFPPGTLTVWGEDIPVAYSDVYSDTSDRLSYYSASGGTYYLVLFPGDEVEFGGDGYLGYTVNFQSNALTGDYDVGAATALPASRADSLNWQSDVNDVYEIDLVEGQQLKVTLVPGGGADFDLALYGPDSPSVWGNAILAQYDFSEDTDEITWLVPPGGAGTYNLEVFTRIHTGSYTMTRSLTTPNVPRVSGANRYSTSTAISKSTWTTADTVVLATGTDPADALAASGIAGALDAPVILVPPYSKYSSLLDVYYELDRLGCGDVYIVGGDAAVDPMIDIELEDLGYNVTRLSGANRYLTAVEVAEEMLTLGSVDTVFVVRGDDYADALAVSPYAFSQGFPVLLTKPNELNAATAAFIKDNSIGRAVIAGGPSAVSNEVMFEIGVLRGPLEVDRYYGSTRYATAKEVARVAVILGWASWDFVGAATGQSFPDALSGGAACGRRGGTLLLTKSTTLGAEVSGAITEHDPDTVMIFGGPAAISAGVETGIQNLMP